MRSEGGEPPTGNNHFTRNRRETGAARPLCLHIMVWRAGLHQKPGSCSGTVQLDTRSSTKLFSIHYPSEGLGYSNRKQNAICLQTCCLLDSPALLPNTKLFPSSHYLKLQYYFWNSLILFLLHLSSQHSHCPFSFLILHLQRSEQCSKQQGIQFLKWKTDYKLYDSNDKTYFWCTSILTCRISYNNPVTTSWMNEHSRWPHR